MSNQVNQHKQDIHSAITTSCPTSTSGSLCATVIRSPTSTSTYPKTMPSLIHHHNTTTTDTPTATVTTPTTSTKRKRLDAVLTKLSTVTTTAPGSYSPSGNLVLNLQTQSTDSSTTIMPDADNSERLQMTLCRSIAQQDDVADEECMEKCPKKQLSLDSEMSMNVGNLNLNIGSVGESSQQCLPSTSKQSLTNIADQSDQANSQTSKIDCSLTVAAAAAGPLSASTVKEQFVIKKQDQHEEEGSTSNNAATTKMMTSSWFRKATCHSHTGDNLLFGSQYEQQAQQQPDMDEGGHVEKNNNKQHSVSSARTVHETNQEHWILARTSTTNTATTSSPAALSPSKLLSHDLAVVSSSSSCSFAAVLASTTKHEPQQNDEEEDGGDGGCCVSDGDQADDQLNNNNSNIQQANTTQWKQSVKQPVGGGRCHAASSNSRLTSSISTTSTAIISSSVEQNAVESSTSPSISSSSSINRSSTIITAGIASKNYHQQQQSSITSAASRSSASGVGGIFKLPKYLPIQDSPFTTPQLTSDTSPRSFVQMPPMGHNRTFISTSHEAAFAHPQHHWSWHNLKISPSSQLKASQCSSPPTTAESLVSLLACTSPDQHDSREQMEHEEHNKLKTSVATTVAQQLLLNSIRQQLQKQSQSQHCNLASSAESSSISKKRSYSDSDVLVDYFNVFKHATQPSCPEQSTTNLPRTESGLIFNPKNGRLVPKPVLLDRSVSTGTKHPNAMLDSSHSEHGTPQDSPLDLSVKSSIPDCLQMSAGSRSTWTGNMPTTSRSVTAVPSSSCSVPSLTSILSPVSAAISGQHASSKQSCSSFAFGGSLSSGHGGQQHIPALALTAASASKMLPPCSSSSLEPSSSLGTSYKRRSHRRQQSPLMGESFSSSCSSSSSTPSSCISYCSSLSSVSSISPSLTVDVQQHISKCKQHFPFASTASIPDEPPVFESTSPPTGAKLMEGDVSLASSSPSTNTTKSDPRAKSSQPESGPSKTAIGSSGSFCCSICGQTFSLHDRLAKHIASRHKNRQQCDSVVKNYLCEICQRSFARSDMLTRHMRLHTGIKPYTCKICDQVFSRSDHLSTHQRTHTGEKPYKCPQCPYAACRRDMITRHMRTHSRYECTPDSSSSAEDFSK